MDPWRKIIWTVGIALVASTLGLALTYPVITPMVLINSAITSAQVLTAAAVFFFLIVLPTVKHAGIMRANFSQRMRGEVSWLHKPSEFIMHTFATLFWMCLLLSLVILFVSTH